MTGSLMLKYAVCEQLKKQVQSSQQTSQFQRWLSFQSTELVGHVFLGEEMSEILPTI